MNWYKDEAEKWGRVKAALGYATENAQEEIEKAIEYWANYGVDPQELEYKPTKENDNENRN